MSTDRTVRPGRDSDRAFWLVAVLLAALTGALLVAVAASAPRVVRVQFDGTKLARTASQRIVVTFDRPVEKTSAGQVRLAPAAPPLRVSTAGRRVTIVTSAPLADGTNYRVTVRGVRGTSTPAAGDASFTVATAQAELYRLVHRPDGTDAVIRSTVTGRSPRVVLERAGITDFALVRDTIVAATADATGRSGLVSAPIGHPERLGALSPPGEGTISGLRSDPATNRVGFLFTGRPSTGAGEPVTDALYTFDLTRGVSVPTYVTADGGWGFVPGSRNVLAVTGGRLVRLGDEAFAVPADRLLSVSSTREEALVVRSGSLATLDLRTGATSPLAGCVGEVSTAALLPDGAVLIGSDGSVDVVTAGTCRAGGRLDAQPLGGYRMEATPGGRQVAVFSPSSPVTSIVDTRSGDVMRALDGTDPHFAR